MWGLLKKYKALLLLILLMLLPLAATSLGFDFKGAVDWMRAQGSRAFLFTIPAHILLSISPMSSDPVAITNGFIYGLTLGSVANWIGSLGGSIVGYWLIYWGTEEVSLPEYLDKLPRWIRNIPVASPLFLIGVRLIPFVGGDIVKYMAPVYRVPFYRFLWCSAIAIIPWAILLAAVGSGMSVLIEEWL
ncbi:hypothetical protein GJ688_03855 [Heliobacillus mobilis]|uniref:TVP38/TMEM64 family membrane protein n=1 Tax=Heliobacterium mobile TaxID=28064 RepID=A0A6I3SH21_HELMO|nr:VTT domain-containing protein [Heliobacterium mobile]MTV48116.1 hypothetical protein [Heliobacterium mobile]